MNFDRLLLGIISLLGFLISLNFELVRRGAASSNRTSLPRFCRIDASSCARILSASEARLFGISNIWIGMAFYFILLIASLETRLLDMMLFGLFFASLVSVGAGAYLTYVLLVKLHVRCTLCMICHAINMIISLLLLSFL